MIKKKMMKKENKKGMHLMNGHMMKDSEIQAMMGKKTTKKGKKKFVLFKKKGK